MARIDDATWRLADVLRGIAGKPRQQSVRARCVRTDPDGTAWVVAPGSSEPTPIPDGAATISAGDEVSLSAGVVPTVTSNLTSPSASMREVVRKVLPVEDLAKSAKAIAEATGQHFWHDDNGAHVSTEEGNPTGAQNTVWNSLGMLFRAGVNNLLAIVAGTDSGMDVYDGSGNQTSNVLASFRGSGVRIGREGESHVSVTQNSFNLLDKYNNSYFAAEGMLDSKVMSLYSTTIKTPPSASAIDTRKTVTWQSATGQGISDLAKYDVDDIVSYDLYLDGELVESDPDEMTETFSGTFATGSLALRLSLGDLQPSTTYTVRVMVRVYDEEVTLPTVRVGADDKSHILLDYHSMQLVDMEGNTYFHVSDLRGADGTVEITDAFTGDGTTKNFYLSFVADTTNYSVTVSDSSGGAVDKWVGRVEFTIAPTDGATITVTYPTSTTKAKALTFGSRGTGNVGALSVVEGSDCIASGDYSHAEGQYTVASGSLSHAEGADAVASSLYAHAEGVVTVASGIASHAEGSDTVASGGASHAQNNHTVAAYEAQTAIGRYNANDPNNAFEIGNGTDDNNRSNALAVDWDGNLTAGNFCDAAMTKDLSNSGIVRACRIGNMLIMSGSLSGCSVSSTFTWTHLAHIDPAELGITSVGSLGALVDVNGGGPSYYGSTNGGGTARIVDGVLYADMQTNAAFTNKFVKFIITAYVE